MKTISRQDFAEWSSAVLVFFCGALAGAQAQQGMNAVQWAGAISAILGSITLAVAIRVWPAPATAAKDHD